jgi:hypothetical protein
MVLPLLASMRPTEQGNLVELLSSSVLTLSLNDSITTEVPERSLPTSFALDRRKQGRFVAAEYVRLVQNTKTQKGHSHSCEGKRTALKLVHWETPEGRNLDVYFQQMVVVTNKAMPVPVTATRESARL